MAYNFDRLAEFFEGRGVLLKGLKQTTYELRTGEFAEKFGSEVDGLMSEGESGADGFARKIKDKYEKKGKIPANTMMDLNLMMVYYVFPYLLKKGGEGNEYATVLKDKWNEVMGCNISYTTYEELYAGFKKRLFGMF